MLRLSCRTDEKDNLEDMEKSMLANDKRQEKMVKGIVRGGNYGRESFWEATAISRL